MLTEQFSTGEHQYNMIHEEALALETVLRTLHGDLRSMVQLMGTSRIPDASVRNTIIAQYSEHCLQFSAVCDSLVDEADTVAEPLRNLLQELDEIFLGQNHGDLFQATTRLHDSALAMQESASRLESAYRDHGTDRDEVLRELIALHNADLIADQERAEEHVADCLEELRKLEEDFAAGFMLQEDYNLSQ